MLAIEKPIALAPQAFSLSCEESVGSEWAGSVAKQVDSGGELAQPLMWVRGSHSMLLFGFGETAEERGSKTAGS